MSADTIRSGTMCLLVAASAESGDFFSGLRARQTRNGRKFFRKDFGEVRFFPERLIVKIAAGLDKCVTKGASEENGGSTMNVSFNHDLMTSFQFEAYWKRGFEMRRADLNVVSKEESYDLAEIEPTAELWKYDLSVRSENVPLTDSLVIVVLAPNGETISRLTGRP